MPKRHCDCGSKLSLLKIPRVAKSLEMSLKQSLWGTGGQEPGLRCFDAKPRARWSRSRGATGALAARYRLGGLHRAAFWRSLGFPNLVRARAALANKVRMRQLEEWKREELRRTPFALLDDPPEELRPKKGRK